MVGFELLLCGGEPQRGNYLHSLAAEITSVTRKYQYIDGNLKELSVRTTIKIIGTNLEGLSWLLLFY
jgi:hypothetical protein